MKLSNSMIQDKSKSNSYLSPEMNKPSKYSSALKNNIDFKTNYSSKPSPYIDINNSSNNYNNNVNNNMFNYISDIEESNTNINEKNDKMNTHNSSKYNNIINKSIEYNNRYLTKTNENNKNVKQKDSVSINQNKALHLNICKKNNSNRNQNDYISSKSISFNCNIDTFNNNTKHVVTSNNTNHNLNNNYINSIKNTRYSKQQTHSSENYNAGEEVKTSEEENNANYIKISSHQFNNKINSVLSLKTADNTKAIADINNSKVTSTKNVKLIHRNPTFQTAISYEISSQDSFMKTNISNYNKGLSSSVIVNKNIHSNNNMPLFHSNNNIFININNKSNNATNPYDNNKPSSKKTNSNKNLISYLNKSSRNVNSVNNNANNANVNNNISYINFNNFNNITYLNNFLSSSINNSNNLNNNNISNISNLENTSYINQNKSLNSSSNNKIISPLTRNTNFKIRKRHVSSSCGGESDVNKTNQHTGRSLNTNTKNQSNVSNLFSKSNMNSYNYNNIAENEDNSISIQKIIGNKSNINTNSHINNECYFERNRSIKFSNKEYNKDNSKNDIKNVDINSHNNVNIHSVFSEMNQTSNTLYKDTNNRISNNEDKDNNTLLSDMMKENKEIKEQNILLKQQLDKANQIIKNRDNEIKKLLKKLSDIELKMVIINNENKKESDKNGICNYNIKSKYYYNSIIDDKVNQPLSRNSVSGNNTSNYNLYINKSLNKISDFLNNNNNSNKSNKDNNYDSSNFNYIKPAINKSHNNVNSFSRKNSMSKMSNDKIPYLHQKEVKDSFDNDDIEEILEQEIIKETNNSIVFNKPNSSLISKGLTHMNNSHSKINNKDTYESNFKMNTILNGVLITNNPTVHNIHNQTYNTILTNSNKRGINAVYDNNNTNINIDINNHSCKSNSEVNSTRSKKYNDCYKIDSKEDYTHNFSNPIIDKKSSEPIRKNIKKDISSNYGYLNTNNNNNINNEIRTNTMNLKQSIVNKPSSTNTCLQDNSTTVNFNNSRNNINNIKKKTDILNSFNLKLHNSNSQNYEFEDRITNSPLLLINKNKSDNNFPTPKILLNESTISTSRLENFEDNYKHLNNSKCKSSNTLKIIDNLNINRKINDKDIKKENYISKNKIEVIDYKDEIEENDYIKYSNFNSKDKSVINNDNNDEYAFNLYSKKLITQSKSKKTLRKKLQSQGINKNNIKDIQNKSQDNFNLVNYYIYETKEASQKNVFNSKNKSGNKKEKKSKKKNVIKDTESSYSNNEGQINESEINDYFKVPTICTIGK